MKMTESLVWIGVRNVCQTRRLSKKTEHGSLRRRSEEPDQVRCPSIPTSSAMGPGARLTEDRRDGYLSLTSSPSKGPKIESDEVCVTRESRRSWALHHYRKGGDDKRPTGGKEHLGKIGRLQGNLSGAKLRKGNLENLHRDKDVLDRTIAIDTRLLRPRTSQARLRV